MPWPPADLSTNDPNPPKHAGLGAADRAIYNAIIAAELIQPERLWWNLVTGTCPAWINQIPDARRRRWIESAYCKRPDVVFEQAGQLVVAEIKPFASYTALGQATMYERLARLKAEPGRPIRGMILTDQADPDLRSTITANDPILVELGEQVTDRPDRPT